MQVLLLTYWSMGYDEIGVSCRPLMLVAATDWRLGRVCRYLAPAFNGELPRLTNCAGWNVISAILMRISGGLRTPLFLHPKPLAPARSLRHASIPAAA